MMPVQALDAIPPQIPINQQMENHYRFRMGENEDVVVNNNDEGEENTDSQTTTSQGEY